MAREIFQLGVDVKTNAAAASRDVNRLRVSLNNLNNALNTSAVAVTDVNQRFETLMISIEQLVSMGYSIKQFGATVVRTFGNVYTSAMTLASRFEVFRYSFEALFGKAKASEVLQGVIDFARLTQFATEDLLELTVTMAAAGKINPFEKIPIGANKAISVLEFIRDLAATTGAPMWQVKFAIQEVLSSTFAEGLRSFQRRVNIAMDPQSVLGYLQSRGIQADVDTALGRLKALITYLTLTGKVAIGLGERVQETMLARLEAVRDTLQFISLDVFRTVFKQSSLLVENIFQVINKLYQNRDLILKLRDAITFAFLPFKKFAEVLTKFVDKIIELSGQYPTLTKLTLAFVVWGGLFAFIGGALLIFIGRIALAISALKALSINVGILSTLLKGLLLTLKLTIVAGLFGGIAYLLYQYIPEVRELGDKLIKTFSEGVLKAKDYLKNAVNKVFEYVDRLFPHSNALEGPFSNIYESGQSLILTFIEGAKSVARIAYTKIKEIFEEYDKALTPLITLLIMKFGLFGGFVKYRGYRGYRGGYGRAYGAGLEELKAEYSAYLERLRTLKAIALFRGEDYRVLPEYRAIRANMLNVRNEITRIQLQSLGLYRTWKDWYHLLRNIRMFFKYDPETLKFLIELSRQYEVLVRRASTLPRGVDLSWIFAEKGDKIVADITKLSLPFSELVDDILEVNRELSLLRENISEAFKIPLENVDDFLERARGLQAFVSYNEIVDRFINTMKLFDTVVEMGEGSLKAYADAAEAMFVGFEKYLSPEDIRKVLGIGEVAKELTRFESFYVKLGSSILKTLASPFFIIDYIIRKIIKGFSHIVGFFKALFRGDLKTYFEDLFTKGAKGGGIFVNVLKTFIGYVIDTLTYFGKFLLNLFYLTGAIGDILEPIYDFIVKVILLALGVLMPVIRIIVRLGYTLSEAVKGFVTYFALTLNMLGRVLTTILKPIAMVLTVLLYLATLILDKILDIVNFLQKIPFIGAIINVVLGYVLLKYLGIFKILKGIVLLSVRWLITGVLGFIKYFVAGFKIAAVVLSEFGIIIAIILGAILAIYFAIKLIVKAIKFGFKAIKFIVLGVYDAFVALFNLFKAFVNLFLPKAYELQYSYYKLNTKANVELAKKNIEILTAKAATRGEEVVREDLKETKEYLRELLKTQKEQLKEVKEGKVIKTETGDIIGATERALRRQAALSFR